MVSKCKKCGEEIIWERNYNNRWEPLNLDGSSHFDTCPYADNFRGKSFKNSAIDYTKLKREKGQKGLDNF